MTSLGAKYGDLRVVDRSTIFASVIDLYSKGDIINECSLQIKFASEMVIDAGGVTRELFSAFWEQAYQLLFEGATLLIPLLHPQSDTYTGKNNITWIPFKWIFASTHSTTVTNRNSCGSKCFYSQTIPNRCTIGLFELE